MACPYRPAALASPYPATPAANGAEAAKPEPRSLEPSLLDKLPAIAILEGCATPMAATDTKGVIMAWNHAATALYQWKAEEAIGKNISMLIASDQIRANHDKFLVDYMSGKASRVVGYPGIGTRRMLGQKKDGTQVPILLGVSDIPVPEENSRVFLASMTDISELQAENAFLKTIFDGRCTVEVNQGKLVVVDSDGQFERLFPTKPTDLLQVTDPQHQRSLMLHVQKRLTIDWSVGFITVDMFILNHEKAKVKVHAQQNRASSSRSNSVRLGFFLSEEFCKKEPEVVRICLDD